MYTTKVGRVGAIGVLFLVLFVARALAGDLREINVPSGSLADAIESLAKQYGVDVIYASEDLRGLTTPGMSGNLDPSEAFGRLLKGTGLAVKVTGNSVLISRQARPHSQSKLPANSAESVSIGPPDASDFCKRHPRDASCKSQEFDDSEIPEILVRGSRSLNGDIRRTADDPQPYVVFDGAEIQRSQAANVSEFLRSRLPMSSSPMSSAQNTSSASATRNSSSNSSSGSINLRGLGTNETLILVDGRRLPLSNIEGDEGQPDINGIPLASIARIEVLPSTASGIYGGGATGGVINIIRRHDYQGLDVKVSYGNTFDSAVANERLDVSGGLDVGGTQINFSVSHSQAGRFTIGERDFSNRAVALQEQNFPEGLAGYYPLGLPRGALENVVSLDGGDLTLKPQYGGASLGSMNTHVPSGYRGPALDGVAGLIANSGSYDLKIPPGPGGLDRELLTTPKVDGASLNVRREFTPWLTAFIDGSLTRNLGTGTFSSVPDSVTLLASAPNSPFRQDVLVSVPQRNAFSRVRNLSSTWQATAGLIARLPHDWTANVDYSFSGSQDKVQGDQTTLSDAGYCVIGSGVPAGAYSPDGTAPCAPSDPRPAVDIFKDSIAHPINFTPYLERVPRTQGFGADLRDVTLRSSGPVWTLSGGPLVLSAAIEDRKDVLKATFFANPLDDLGIPPQAYSYYPERSRNSLSFYLEALSPLTRMLELQTSVRHDQYDTHRPAVASYDSLPTPDIPQPSNFTNRFKSTDYTVALRFTPVQDVALRVSFGTGFLPASVQQLIPLVQTNQTDVSFGDIPDPKRGGEAVGSRRPFTSIDQGNPNLLPELSKSVSAGLILTPRFAPGLRFSIDYSRTAKTHEIRGLPSDFLFTFESRYPGRVKRGPKLPGDPANWLGPIIYLDTSLINLARANAVSYDFQAEYETSSEFLGDFHWHALATWQQRNQEQTFLDEPSVDIVGYTGEPLAWQGNFGLDWTRGFLYAQWNVQYWSSYRVYDAYDDPSIREIAVRSQGSSSIPSQMYHDVLASYRFHGAEHGAGHVFGNTEISMGIQNVFNKSPPIVASVLPYAPGYSTYGDPRLRRYSLTFRKSW